MHIVSHKRIAFALQTVYGCTISLLLATQWQWGGYITYLSHMLTVIMAYKYIGRWQMNCWALVGGIFVGSVVGTLIGMTYKYIGVHIALLYFGIAWVERTTALPQASKGLALICTLLGALYPILTRGEMSSASIFVTLLLLLYIPLGITGFVLFFPYPSLAAHPAKQSLAAALQKTKELIDAHVRGFSNHDFSDFYISEIDNILQVLRPELVTLLDLASCVQYEALLFPSLTNLAPTIRHVVSIIRNIIVHIELQKRLIVRTCNNNTHKLFQHHLESSLYGINSDLKIAVDVVEQYLVHYKYNNTVIDSYFALWNGLRELLVDFLICLRRWLGQCGSTLCRLGRWCVCTDHGDSEAEATQPVQEVTGKQQKADERTPRRWKELERVIAGMRKGSGKGGAHTQVPALQSDRVENGEKADLGNHLLAQMRRGVSSLSFPSSPKLHDDTSGKSATPNDTSGNYKPLDASGGDATVPDLESGSMRSLSDLTSPAMFVSKYDELAASLDSKQLELLQNYHNLRRVYMYRQFDCFVGFNNRELPRLPKKYRFKEHNPTASPSPGVETKEDVFQPNTGHVGDKVGDAVSPEQLEVLKLLADLLWEDNHRLGMRNLSPRGAFLYRLTAIADEIYALQHVFVGSLGSSSKQLPVGSALAIVGPNPCQEAPFSAIELLQRTATLPFTYMLEAVQWQRSILCGIFAEYVPWLVPRSSCLTAPASAANWRAAVAIEMRALIQPCKLALAITGAALFVILSQLNSKSYSRNSLWATVTIAIVRRDISASSFLVGSQRLLGTVVGAVFAFAMFQAFACEQNESIVSKEVNKCGYDLTIPLLMGWLLICSLFREGPNYGAAATAAGFTPLVLFLGRTQGTAEGAWLRVQMTILGVFFYLLVDNLIMPTRADGQLRNVLLTSLGTVTESLHGVVVSLKLLNNANDSDVAGSQQPSSALNGPDTDKTRNVDKDIEKYLSKHEHDIGAASNQRKSDNDVIKSKELTVPPPPPPLPQSSPPLTPTSVHSPPNNSPNDNGGGDVFDDSDITETYRLNEEATPMSRRLRKFSNTCKPSSNLLTSQDESSGPSSSRSAPVVVEMELLKSRRNREQRAMTSVGISQSPSLLVQPRFQPQSALALQQQPKLRTDSDANSVLPTEDVEFNDHMWSDVFQCEDNLAVVRTKLLTLHATLLKADVLLPLCVLEPQLLSRVFPTDAYTRAFSCLLNIFRSGKALSGGIFALCNVLTRLHSKNALLCLSVIGYISRQIIKISERGHRAMVVAHRVLAKLFSHSQHEHGHAVNAADSKPLLGEVDDDNREADDEDLTDIIILSKLLEKTQVKVDEYIRKIYFKRTDTSNLHPYFLVTWQNMHENMIAWIQDFTKLGIALRNIRDLEL